MFIQRDLVPALIALGLIWPHIAIARSFGRSIRQTTRKEVVARQSRTLTAHRRQTSPIPNCGVPSGSQFYLQATGSGISAYLIAQFGNLYNTDDSTSASVFSLDAGTCNLDYDGNLANIFAPFADGIRYVNLDTAAEIQSSGEVALTCSVSNDQLSCNAQGYTVFWTCGDNSLIGLGESAPAGCSEVTLSLAAKPCGVAAGTQFYLEVTGSGIDGYVVAVNDGTGDLALTYSNDAVLASPFSLDAGTCDLDYNGDLANIRPNSDLGSLYFDTPAQIQAGGYATVSCAITNNQLSCSADGETIAYSCGANTALGFGSVIPDGCEQVTLTVISQPCGITSTTPFYLQASGSGTAADGKYLVTADNGGGSYVGILSGTSASQASTFYIQNTVGSCNLDYNGEPATTNPASAQGNTVIFDTTDTISADGLLPATCVVQSSSVLDCNGQFTYVCPPALSIGIGSTIPSGCSVVTLTVETYAPVCGLPDGTNFYLTAYGDDINGLQLIANVGSPAAMFGSIDAASVFTFAPIDDGSDTCYLVYDGYVAALDGSDGTDPGQYIAWLTNGPGVVPLQCTAGGTNLQCYAESWSTFENCGDNGLYLGDGSCGGSYTFTITPTS